MPTYPFDIVDILSSEREETGAVLLQIGDVINSRVIDSGCPFFQTAGIVSVPPPPVPGKSAMEAICLKTVDKDVIIATRDLRGSVIAGQLKQGEACVYATIGAARTMYKADGSVINFTTDDNTENGKSVYSGVTPVGFIRVSPFGKETFGERGYHLLHASGARIDCGSITIPGIPSTLNSYVSFSAQSVRIEGAAISLGTVAGVQEPIAKATTTLATFTAMSAALSAVSTALTVTAEHSALMTPLPGSVGPAGLLLTAMTNAVIAMSAAMSAMATELGVAAIALPSTSTTVV